MHFDRDALIRQHLYAHGQSSIQQLADLADASLATIRRDLQRLEEKGVIERLHGGARIAEPAGREVAFEAREQQNIAAKRAIGAAAYVTLRPRSTVFLDAGTTVLQCARQLRLTPIELSVFTNSLAVAQLLAGVGEISVTMLGGRLRPENLSLVGPLAEATIDTLWFDQLLLGASAIQPDGTLATLDADEASLNARMLRRATRRCVLADAGKFDRTATYGVAQIGSLTDLICDDALDEPWRQRLRQSGVTLTLAKASVLHA